MKGCLVWATSSPIACLLPLRAKDSLSPFCLPPNICVGVAALADAHSIRKCNERRPRDDSQEPFCPDADRGNIAETGHTSSELTDGQAPTSSISSPDGNLAHAAGKLKNSAPVDDPPLNERQQVLVYYWQFTKGCSSKQAENEVRTLAKESPFAFDEAYEIAHSHLAQCIYGVLPQLSCDIFHSVLESTRHPLLVKTVRDAFTTWVADYPAELLDQLTPLRNARKCELLELVTAALKAAREAARCSTPAGKTTRRATQAEENQRRIALERINRKLLHLTDEELLKLNSLLISEKLRKQLEMKVGKFEGKRKPRTKPDLDEQKRELLSEAAREAVPLFLEGQCEGQKEPVPPEGINELAQEYRCGKREITGIASDGTVVGGSAPRGRQLSQGLPEALTVGENLVIPDHERVETEAELRKWEEHCRNKVLAIGGNKTYGQQIFDLYYSQTWEPNELPAAVSESCKIPLQQAENEVWKLMGPYVKLFMDTDAMNRFLEEHDTNS